MNDFLLSAGLELLPHLVEASGTPDPAILRDLHEVRGMLLGRCAEGAGRKAPAVVLLGTYAASTTIQTCPC